jgi:hypothetical protein
LTFGGTVYDLIVYPDLVYHGPGVIYENFHPGLRRDDGDMFVVMFQYSVGSRTTPFYVFWREGWMRQGRDAEYNAVGSTTTAVACVEQYQLCLHKECTGWASAANVTEEMTQILQRGYNLGTSSETLAPQALLIEAGSLRSFLWSHYRQPMIIRTLMPENATMNLDMYLHGKQWHWEVQSWFNLAFLTTKFSLLTSSQGDTREVWQRTQHFPNTSWICDKILYLDDDYTNVNLIGLMSTMGGFAMIILLSYVHKVNLAVKEGLRLCRVALQALAKKLRRLFQRLLRGLKLMKAFTQSFSGLGRALGPGWIPSFWYFRSRTIDNGDYLDDDERPSFRLEP